MTNKALLMILEWAEAIRLTPYRDTYNALLAKGIQFPERTPEMMVPIHTPPQSVMQDIAPEDAAAIAAAIEQAERELAREREMQVEEGTRRRVAEHIESGVDFMNARKARGESGMDLSMRPVFVLPGSLAIISSSRPRSE